MNWYVKNADGKVFGPVDDAKLLVWVKDGRVEPFAGISNDLKQWKLASLEPSLEMDWIVENEPGRFYGPTHRAVIDDLIKSKAISESCRIYRDDHGGAVEREAAAARDEAEKAMEEIRAEAEKAMAELKDDAEKSLSAKDREIAALKEAVSASTARAEKGDIDAVEALEMFGHRAALYVGGYNTLIGGADAIIMAGGIGENAAELREQIVKRLGALGVKLDKKANKAIRGGKSGVISAKDSKIPVVVIPTNEELMIARETKAVLS